MNRRTRMTVRALTIIVPMSVGVAIASDYNLDWWTVDGGGEVYCTGGTYELSGTAGQLDAGYMTGGTYELTGGFWAGAVDRRVPSLFDLLSELDAGDGQEMPPP